MVSDQIWKFPNFSCNIFGSAWCCTRLATWVQRCFIRALAPPFNILQQGGQTCATGCAQKCCNMLRWIVVCLNLFTEFLCSARARVASSSKCSRVNWKVVSIFAVRKLRFALASIFWWKPKKGECLLRRVRSSYSLPSGSQRLTGPRVNVDLQDEKDGLSWVFSRDYRAVRHGQVWGNFRRLWQ